MATIKKLKLKLNSGLLSELHSDLIFGHFAWRMLELLGEEKLEEFLQYYLNGSPVFTISDGFLENNNSIYFPKPLKLTPAKQNSGTKKERIISFLKQKESKQKRLVTLAELNLFLKGNYEDFEKSLQINDVNELPKFYSDLRVSVEIDRHTNTSKDGQLFSYHPNYLDKSTFICIFIKILDNDKWTNYECDSILKSVFEIGFGKKKSSGYGHFELIEFDDFNEFDEADDSNGFISLSHYLPANSDKIDDAFYALNVKYGKLGEQKSNAANPFKKPLILLEPGSCFITKERKEFYGRAVDKINDYLPKVMQNGFCFSLNCKFKG